MGHSTAPQRGDTEDEEAASLSVNRKNEHEASRGLGQQGLPEAAPTLRNEGRCTNPAFIEKPFTE